MNQVDLIKKMEIMAHAYQKRCFLLREIATLFGISRPAAGMLLLRAQDKGIVFRAGNLWVNQINPPDLFEVGIALRSPSYLSFESALYRHHLLSQSPKGGLTFATSKRPGLFNTPMGIIHYVHLKPPLFFGFTTDRIADPEKAWLDLIYIRGLKNREIQLSENFYLEKLNKNKIKKTSSLFPIWVQKIALELL